MTSPVVRLGISDLEARFNADRSTIWRWYKSGRFPAPEYLADRRVWRLDVIEAWEAERLSRPPEARRGNTNIAAK
jgi:predicted DNA-binding transcriptional regulator AlpA